MNTAPLFTSRLLKTALLAMTTIVVALACIIAAYDDRHGELSLKILEPAIRLLVSWSAPLENHTQLLLEWMQSGLVGVAVLILLVSTISQRGKLSSSSFYACAAFSGMYGAASLALQQRPAALAGYGLCVILMLASYLTKNRSQSLDLDQSRRAEFTLTDLALVSGVILIALVLRFYALNRIFDYFEGEETPFAMAGNDLRAMSLANIGEGGPWSPFGYIYFFLVYVPTNLFGTSILSLRLGAAVPSMAILILIYFFLRNVFSNGVALAATFVLAMDAKQVSWARYEFPHGSTAFTSVAICWLTYLTFHKKSFVYPALLVLFMGLCFHQYPSGQTGFVIPFLYLTYCVLLNRSERLSFYLVRLGFLIAGCCLWFYGHSIAQYFVYHEWRPPRYLARFDTRVSWHSSAGDSSIVARLIFLCELYGRNTFDLFASMVERSRIAMPPQDHVPPFDSIPTRTIFLMVPPLALVSLMYFLGNVRWRQGALLLCWIVAAAAPCVLSDEAHARRAATIFPALMCLAACGYILVRRSVTSVMGRMGRICVPSIEILLALSLTGASIHQWFSGRHMKYGEPGEMAIVRKIQELSPPGSLIFFDYNDHYMPGRMTYLLLDFLSEKREAPISWMLLHGDPSVFDAVMEDPKSSTRFLSHAIEYRWSRLRDQLPAIRDFTDWKKIVFISERFPSGPLLERSMHRLGIVRTKCTAPSELDINTIPNFYHHFTILTCDI